MFEIAAVTVPFFALVLAGYVAAHTKVLPEAAIGGLNAFVLFFALPCMLFRFGAGTPFAQLVNPVLFAAWIACALTIVALAVLHARAAGRNMADSSFGALVAAFPNTGFMGVPLLVGLLGPQAAGPAIVTILVDLVLTSSLCIALAQLGGSKSLAQSFTAALKGVTKNPMPWAIGLGVVFSAFGLHLPGPVDTTVKLLGDAASPVALFTIGTVLWRSRQNLATRTPVNQWADMVLLKLLVHPILVLTAGVLLINAGLTSDRFALTVMVLVAALPSASNVSLLTERFGADTGRVARIILWSTVAAFFTFPAIAWLAGAGR